MIQSNEVRIVKSLETIAKCMVKSNEMAREALEKSNKLYGANMAMMRESQIKPDIKVVLNEEQLKDLDGT